MFFFFFHFISGQSVSPPIPFDCIPTIKVCEGKSDCPQRYPLCFAGRCCRRPTFPPFCPLNRRGPRCGPRDPQCKPGYKCTFGYCCRIVKPPICPVNRRGPKCDPKYPPCKPGYTCRGDHCCRDAVIPPKCPIDYVSGPLCPPSRCPAAFTCMKGRCCRKRIITPRCPKGMLYTGRCPTGKCRVGSCINGVCCVKISPPPRCPRALLYTGRCINGRCRIGKCMNGACCRDGRINITPIGKSSCS